MNLKNDAIFYFITQWVPGLLTNNKQITNSLLFAKQYITRLAPFFDRDQQEHIQGTFMRTSLKFSKRIRRNMTTPSIIFSLRDSAILLNETQNINIPLVAVCDTQSRYDQITYPIVANQYSMSFGALVITLLSEISNYTLVKERIVALEKFWNPLKERMKRPRKKRWKLRQPQDTPKRLRHLVQKKRKFKGRQIKKRSRLWRKFAPSRKLRRLSRRRKKLYRNISRRLPKNKLKLRKYRLLKGLLKNKTPYRIWHRILYNDQFSKELGFNVSPIGHVLNNFGLKYSKLLAKRKQLFNLYRKCLTKKKEARYTKHILPVIKTNRKSINIASPYMKKEKPLNRFKRMFMILFNRIRTYFIEMYHMLIKYIRETYLLRKNIAFKSTRPIFYKVSYYSKPVASRNDFGPLRLSRISFQDKRMNQKHVFKRLKTLETLGRILRKRYKLLTKITKYFFISKKRDQTRIPYKKRIYKRKRYGFKMRKLISKLRKHVYKRRQFKRKYMTRLRLASINDLKMKRILLLSYNPRYLFLCKNIMKKSHLRFKKKLNKITFDTKYQERALKGLVKNSGAKPLRRNLKEPHRIVQQRLSFNTYNK